MAVRKIRNTWWVDFRFNLDRIRKRSPENSKAGAEAYEVILRRRLTNGDPLEGNKPLQKILLRDFAKEWVETYVKNNNKPSEQRSKDTILRSHLIPFFGDRELKDIKAEDIEKYKNYKLQKKLCPKTINNHLAILSKCLGTAMDWGRLENKPKIKFLKTVSQRLNYLTPAESQQLISGCDEPIWKMMILVALRTGMRLGELFGLEWQDVDFKKRQITVSKSIVYGIVGTPKNNKTRYIPITDETCRALYDSRRASGLVFCRKDGRPFTWYMAHDAIERIHKKAEVKRITWHVLRHTFASQLAMKGISIIKIKELMGHSSIATTMRYAHLAPSVLRDAVNVLEEVEKPETDFFGQQAVNTGNFLTQILT